MKIIVLRTTFASGGTDTSGIPDDRTIKREEIVGVIVPPTEKLFMELGINLSGDALLYTRTRLDMENDILYDEIIYEITQEIPAPLLYIGNSYTYVLKRVPALATDLPGDGLPSEGYSLVLNLEDLVGVTDGLVTSVS